MAIYGVKELQVKLECLAEFDVVPFLEIAGEEVANRATELAPVREGTLRRSIHSMIVSDKEVAIGTDGTASGPNNAPYDIYQHEGTGKYASNGNGRKGWWVYADEPYQYTGKGSGKVYNKGQAAWIKNWLIEEKGIPEDKLRITEGVKPTKFLTKALDELTDSGEIEKILKEEIKRQSGAGL